eukprot:TRINITY_DN9957_c1_g1_i1.p1 TRINITY_DN9957_c1_g1~~TRINITY_DN9957_c1_g1_i1.p1  ORF type:complete len:205 (+),score=42.81 TRINITY_DN9957_c1_g1_i1:64-615(+)
MTITEQTTTSPQAPISRWCRFVMKRTCTFVDCIYGHLEDHYAGVLGVMPNLMLKDKKTLVQGLKTAFKEIEKEGGGDMVASEISKMCGRALTASDVPSMIDTACATLHFDINGAHPVLNDIVKYLITVCYPYISAPCPSNATPLPSFATPEHSDLEESSSTVSSEDEPYSGYPTIEFLSCYYM